MGEAPRLGNGEFASAFNKLLGGKHPSWRITHHKDPIVHLPPESFGFYHVNTEVFFGGESKWYKICDPSEDRGCSDQYWNLPYDIFYGSDHVNNPAFGPGF